MKTAAFKSFALLIFFFALAVETFGKPEATVEEYIQKYKSIAVREMKRSGIPASITLAQGILESGMGTSILATKGNNHFGIKCHKEWTGKTMKHTDDAPNECFRVYDNPEESFLDHSHFLRSRPHYANLFQLDIRDYVGWAHGLKKSGYATNPRYAYMLIDVIERHQLYVYDQDIDLAEMDKQRGIMKEREKEELIVLQNKKAPVGTYERNVKVSVPVSKPVPSLNEASVSSGSVVFYNNKVKVVRVRDGETMSSIAKYHNVSLGKLQEYNDMKPSEKVSTGQLVYLGSKKTKATKKTHLVLAHENLWSISQNYGIKLSKLYERNMLRPGEEPAVGAMIYLNKVAPKKPALRPKNFKQPASDVTVSINTTNHEPHSNPNFSIETPVKTNTTKTVGEVFEEKKVQSSTPVFSSTPKQTGGAKSLSHLVQKGDTLYNISKRYNVTVAQIKEWNNLLDEGIKLGQELVIFQQ